MEKKYNYNKIRLGTGKTISFNTFPCPQFPSEDATQEKGFMSTPPHIPRSYKKLSYFYIIKFSIFLRAGDFFFPLLVILRSLRLTWFWLSREKNLLPGEHDVNFTEEGDFEGRSKSVGLPGNGTRSLWRRNEVRQLAPAPPQCRGGGHWLPPLLRPRLWPHWGRGRTRWHFGPRWWGQVSMLTSLTFLRLHQIITEKGMKFHIFHCLLSLVKW